MDVDTNKCFRRYMCIRKTNAFQSETLHNSWSVHGPLLTFLSSKLNCFKILNLQKSPFAFKIDALLKSIFLNGRHSLVIGSCECGM